MTPKRAQDSLGRLWEVRRDGDGQIELIPIGHDTDPDGPGLSVKDELALLALAEDDGAEMDDDQIGFLYDQARDRLEAMMAGCV
jgi:hypothetical protein